LERAIDQRSERESEKRKALSQADMLAYQALTLAKSKNLLTSPYITAVTYLHKVASVRVIPYGPMALIGIPYSSIDTDEEATEDSNFRDYLAIPHEAGHYVYNHGEYESQKIYEYLINKFEDEEHQRLQKYTNWLEEIFADVYSCLVGGLVTAVSIQDILFDNLPSRFNHDDSSHPPHVIRPYIYTHIIRNEKAFKDEGWATTLEEWWQAKLEQRGNPQSFIVSSEEISTKVGRTDLEEIVDIILKIFLTSSDGQDESASAEPWVSVAGNSNNTDPLDIYRKFVVEVKKNTSWLHRDKLNISFTYDENKNWIPQARKSNGSLPANVGVLGNEIVARMDYILELVKAIPTEGEDNLGKAGPIDENNHLCINTWYWLFDSGGWTSGGDEDTYPNRTIESEINITISQRRQLREEALGVAS
jgi:hypothetical protein